MDGLGEPPLLSAAPQDVPTPMRSCSFKESIWWFLQPSEPTVGSWEGSSVAELLPGPLTAPVTWIHPSPGAAAADSGSWNRGHWDKPCGSCPINISVPKKSVSFHLSRAHGCVAGLPFTAGLPDPAAFPSVCSSRTRSCPAGVPPGPPASSLHQNTCGDCRDLKEHTAKCVSRKKC